MKFSKMQSALKHKYRNEADPALLEKQRFWNKLVYSAAAVLLITAVVLNILSAGGHFTAEPDIAPWSTPQTQEPITVGVVDRSYNVKSIVIDERRINQPSIYGHELLFSAGKGSLDSSILTNLYLFDAVTGEAKKITESKLSGGEIYETYISENWIVWLDTDHKGKNVIYKMSRRDIKEIKANTISVVQEAENHMPKLGLYGDYLIWMEQVSASEDKLYFVDLTTDENMALQMFDQTNYAVSTPYIYKNTVIWAERDPERPEDDSVSAIYNVIFEDLGTVDGDDDYEPEEDSGILEPEIFSPGTYVHNPMCNDDVFVWIDKNNAPDSSLYYAYKDGRGEPVRYWRNVTQYAVGDDFIVFASNQIIYAYYYESDILVQVSESGRSSILPQAFGTLVVWEDKSDTSGNDVFKYNILG